MRYQSIVATIHSLTLAIVVLQNGTLLGQQLVQVPSDNLSQVERLPRCVSYAQSSYSKTDQQAYKDKRSCLIQIDRGAVATLPAFTLPKNTTVVIEVINARENEKLAFTISNTKTLPPDPFAGAIKTVTSPLGSLVIIQKSYAATDQGKFNQDEITEKQNEIKTELNSVQSAIDNANAALNCLSSYEVLQDDYLCDQKDMIISPGSTAPADVRAKKFGPQKEQARNLVGAGYGRVLPLQEITDLDSKVKGWLSTCLDDAKKKPTGESQASAVKDCEMDNERHLTNEQLIDAASADIQKSQYALMGSARALDKLTIQPPQIAYQFVSIPFVNSSVAVTGLEPVLNAKTTVVTETINTQAVPWVVSAGIGFSNLKAFTYTNAPIIVNGEPVLDPSGKATTVVTRSETSPSIITPQALISYRIKPLSRANWENAYPGGISILMSGGIGANLTSKTADFDTGFSIGLGSVLFTPSVHFGRESRLIDGVEVGQKLGSSPPSPLPTQNFWVRKFAFSVTYAITLPLSGQ